MHFYFFKKQTSLACHDASVEEYWRVCTVQATFWWTDEGQHASHHSLASSAQCTNSALETCYCALSAAHQEEQDTTLGHHVHSAMKSSRWSSAALNG